MSSFKEKYVNEMVYSLSLVYGNDPEVQKELKKRVNDIYDKSKQDSELRIYNNYKQSEMNITGERFLNLMEDNKPVITGYGTIFKVKENVPGKILRYLGSKRKAVKAKMFEHIKDVDPTLYNMYDLMQKVIKVLANAYYGAFGQVSFQFFNPFLGPSVTYTGVIIIQSAVLAFEAFLSGNFVFDNFDELVLYVKNIHKEEHDSDVSLFGEIENIDELLCDWLYSKVNFDFTEYHAEVLSAIIENLSYSQKEVLLCKNNMNLFLQSEYVIDLLLNCVHPKFTDANEPPEEIKEYVDELLLLTEYFVMYHYQWHNREVKAERNRDVIVISDTDSTFLYLGPYTDWYKTQSGKEKLERIERINCSNVFTYLSAKLVKKVFMNVTKNLNVPEKERDMIDMKNEFYYSRLSISENKKQYGGLCDSKEGKVYDVAKLDVKGLSIKKVSTPKIARNSFLSILENDILKCEVLNPKVVFEKFIKFEREIKSSLQKGETKFSRPSKYSSFRIYKLPYQMQVVRGVFLWNALYPENSITEFSNVNMFRLSSMKPEVACNFFKKLGKSEEVQNMIKNIQKMEYEIKVKKSIESDIKSIDDIPLRDIDIICLPKNVESLPKELIPLINIPEIIDRNMKNGNILLNIVGYKTLKSLKYDSYSNIVDV